MSYAKVFGIGALKNEHHEMKMFIVWWDLGQTNSERVKMGWSLLKTGTKIIVLFLNIWTYPLVLLWSFFTAINFVSWLLPSEQRKLRVTMATKWIQWSETNAYDLENNNYMKNRVNVTTIYASACESKLRRPERLAK